MKTADDKDGIILDAEEDTVRESFEGGAAKAFVYSSKMMRVMYNTFKIAPEFFPELRAQTGLPCFIPVVRVRNFRLG